MKSIQTLFTYATAALLTNSASGQFYPPSRADTKVSKVIQISAQGSHTPGKIYPDLIKNNEDIPATTNYLTPLGVRQQYMIGDELRYRYVLD